MADWIRESNLIEGIDDAQEDYISQEAWKKFQAFPYLNLFAIMDLHRWITERQFRIEHIDEWSGKPRVIGFEGINVTVSGRRCPPWQTVPKLLEEWIVTYRQPKTWEGTKEAHIQFENIHPFRDGNGRVGRMILQYHRLKIGLEPLLIKASEREDYYAWFKDL